MTDFLFGALVGAIASALVICALADIVERHIWKKYLSRFDKKNEGK